MFLNGAVQLLWPLDFCPGPETAETRWFDDDDDYIEDDDDDDGEEEEDDNDDDDYIEDDDDDNDDDGTADTRYGGKIYWKVNIKILPGQERKWRGCFYCRAKIRLHHV